MNENLKQYKEFAKKLKVLCEPSRLAIIDFLGKGPQNVTSIVEEIGLEQSLVSHHLRVLKAAGLLVSEKHGKTVFYRVAAGIGKSKKELALDLGCCRISLTD